MTELREFIGYMDTVENIVKEHKHIKRSQYETEEDFLECLVYTRVEDVISTLESFKLTPTGGDEQFTNGWNQAMTKIRKVMRDQMMEVIKDSKEK